MVENLSADYHFLEVSSAESADADFLRPNVPTFDETWFRLAARFFAGFLPLMQAGAECRDESSELTKQEGGTVLCNFPR
jgi:hypothetical protein